MDYTIKIPSNFDALEYVQGSFAANSIGDCMSKFVYTIGDKESAFTNIYRYNEDSKSSDVIVNEESPFANGFKVVRLSDGLFGYVRESDGKLMEPRFTIAGDFNELGYAMVGTTEGVCWIDKDFKSCSFGKNSDRSDILRWSKYDVHQANMFNIVGKNDYDYPIAIANFSEGPFHLAGILSKSRQLQFMKDDGEIQSFKIVSFEPSYYRLFNGNIKKVFNREGYLILNSGILFAKGFYAPVEVVWNILSGKSEIFKDLATDVNQTEAGDLPKAFVMTPTEQK